MPNPVVITVTDATVKFGADALTAVDYKCQVTEASINANPNLQTVPATFCSPESQAPASTGYELALTWLQDWTAPGGGLSKWAFDNDTKEMYFELFLNDPTGLIATDVPVASGQLRVTAGAYGGAAGTPLTATATWPIIGKPTIGVEPASGGLLAAEPETAKSKQKVDA